MQAGCGISAFSACIMHQTERMYLRESSDRVAKLQAAELVSLKKKQKKTLKCDGIDTKERNLL